MTKLLNNAQVQNADDAENEQLNSLEDLAERQAFEDTFDSSKEQNNESFIERLRVFIWPEHQFLLARALLVCFLGMNAYFGVQYLTNQQLVDIDDVRSLTAEFKIDINSAEFGEIVVLPGVGRKLAVEILDYRNSVERIESHDQLLNVHGIGEKKLLALRPYLLPIESN